MQSTVMVLLGTRPEAISLRRSSRLCGRTTLFRTVVCSTGQHREMLRQAVDLFGIACDMELDVMQPNQTLPALTGRLFHAIGGAVAEARPDWVIVQGDTATAFVARPSAITMESRLDTSRRASVRGTSSGHSPKRRIVVR